MIQIGLTVKQAKESLLYYSNGNYDFFANLHKRKGVESKIVWFVGSGLAALLGAAFLSRDCQRR